MRVGIVLNYTRHDSTYAALKTAEVIRDLGYGVLFFDKTTKTNRANLHVRLFFFLVIPRLKK